MAFWVTGDQHFGHRNIIKYCDRPFESVKQMDETMIENYNCLVSPDDTCFMLGDFGMDKKRRLFDILDRLNGEKILLMGSHDRVFSKRTIIHKIVVKFEEHMIAMTHTPYDYDERCHFTLCAHIHRRWKYSFKDDHLLINAGVDQWNFCPVNLHQVVEYSQELLQAKGIA